MRFNFLDIKSKPKNKFSLENLAYIYNELLKNPTINENNKGLIIECLRQLAEVMIWGDQHAPEFFDFFLEKNLLSFFLKILSQKTNKQVKIQLIQTLSILVENIRNQNSIYYLFSNNHINELITHKFDFSDDEVLAYYISFLKTISLKLNPNTIQFFYDARKNDFPLYTEAIKFFNQKDGMIRIAVRTLTLNVFKVEDIPMRRYILDKTAAPYFTNIVWFIRDQCTKLDSVVSNSSYKNKAQLDDFVAELLDFFFYLHDIFNLGIPELSQVLTDHLIQYLLFPQILGSLIPSEKLDALEDRLSPFVALFLLGQVFYIFTHKPLIDALTGALIGRPNCYSPSQSLPPIKRHNRNHSAPDIKFEEKRKPFFEGVNIIETLLTFLDCDDRTTLTCLCLFYAICKNSSASPEMLNKCGLLPFKIKKAKSILEALTSPKPDALHRRSISLGSREESVEEIKEDIPLFSENNFENSDAESRKFIDKLLTVLGKSDECRLITLQMGTLLIKELAYSQDSGANLTKENLEFIDKVYGSSITKLSNSLKGPLSDIFIELFDHQIKIFKQINFDGLLTDITTLLLPVSTTPLSGIALPKRLPSGESEKTEKAIQSFLVLRELKFTFSKIKDDLLPLKEDPLPSIQVKDLINFDKKLYFPVEMNTPGLPKKRQKRFLIIDPQLVILTEPDQPRSLSKKDKVTKLERTGIVTNVIPVQNIELENDGDKALQLTSHQLTWTSTLYFVDVDSCRTAQKQLEQAKFQVRSNKIRQIENLFVDHNSSSTNKLASTTSQTTEKNSIDTQ